MLQLKHIRVDADDHKEILGDVSLTVPRGKFVAITGPNGGGKSTLAKVIMGIMNPSQGQILFEGEDITGFDITKRARLGIAFSFQQPVRFKGITVRDLVELAAGKKMDETQMCSYLSQVGLCAADYIDRPVDDSLSGGEIKRIEIAGVMARQAKLSVFDEPEAGIDLWSFQNLIEVFQKMQRENDGTIVVISHQERILRIADEIVVLADGTITAQGPTADVLPALLAQETCTFCPKPTEVHR